MSLPLVGGVSYCYGSRWVYTFLGEINSQEKTDDSYHLQSLFLVLCLQPQKNLLLIYWLARGFFHRITGWKLERFFSHVEITCVSHDATFLTSACSKAESYGQFITERTRKNLISVDFIITIQTGANEVAQHAWVTHSISPHAPPHYYASWTKPTEKKMEQKEVVQLQLRSYNWWDMIVVVIFSD